MKFDRVDARIARGILMLIWGAHLTPTCPILVSFQCLDDLDVSSAWMTMRFIRVDASIADGILTAIKGQI